ncbi:MAG: M24 family metallopeptidase [Alphaproteobacteria bacterium]
MMLKDFEVQPDMARMRAYRLGRVQQQIRANDLAGALLFNSIHLRYATGTRSVQVFNMHTPYRSAFIPPAGKVVMNDWQTEGLPILDTVAEYRPSRNFAYFPAGERHEDIARAFAKDIAALVKKHGGRNRRVAVDIIEPVGLLALQAHGLEVISAERLMQHAKVIKSPDEIACMVHTVSIAEAGMARMREALRPGMTENELWSILHQTNIAMGGEYFEYRLMASGGRTNPWNQECSDKLIRAGELVAFDCGMVGPYGYVADVSRTLHCPPGRPTATQRDLYRRAYDYLHHNLALIRAGADFRMLSRNGATLPRRFFRNRYNMIVHSIGMADEWPSIPYKDDWARDGYDGRLEPGMTVCVESYFGAEGGVEGVKLEQQVLVTRDGYQLLSTFPFEDALLA